MASALRVPAGGWPLEEAARSFSAPRAPHAPLTLLTSDAAKALGAWLTLMVQWNARIDLTAARSTEELVDLMLADALLLAGHIPEKARVVDVGSGAGAPGLALALVRPDLVVTLAEPLAKRTAFLRTVLAAIGRTDIRVESVRGEGLAQAGSTFDVAMARATLPPPEWLELGVRLVPAVGAVWVLLAKEDAPLSEAAVAELSLEYEWPLTHAKRRAVRYRRSG